MRYGSEWGQNRFGTILGEQSLAEVQDLLTAKNQDMAALANAILSTPATSFASMADYNDFKLDWAKLQNRFQAAAAKAAQAVAAGKSGWITDLSIQPDQADYDAIISALQQVPGTVTKGDKQDLYNRLNAVKAIPAYKVQQPIKDSDFDMKAWQALAPLDPLGDKKAAENWKRDIAIGIAATVIGAGIVAAISRKF